MTLAIEKMTSELALKHLRGEDIDADLNAGFASLSKIEKQILAQEAIQDLIREVVDADPTLEMFTNDDGQLCIRRAAA